MFKIGNLVRIEWPIPVFGFIKQLMDENEEAIIITVDFQNFNQPTMVEYEVHQSSLKKVY